MAARGTRRPHPRRVRAKPVKPVKKKGCRLAAVALPALVPAVLIRSVWRRRRATATVADADATT